MTILDEIFASKRLEVERRIAERPLSHVRRDAEAAPQPMDFSAALRAARRKPALIAEVKRASPSRGVLARNFDPLLLARTYQQNGAAAVSVLTDEKYFLGSLAYLADISEDFNRSATRLPLLRKDFICDPYQVYESRAAGADAILLIAAYLDDACLKDLHLLSGELGIAALVEVHSRDELESVLRLSPRLVGINNRDLRDFSVRLETTLELRPMLPAEVCLVAESGIHAPEDVARMRAAGVDAVLVGEALVTASDVAEKVRSLVG